MSAKTIAEYGFWKSPVTSDYIAAKTLRLGEVSIEEGAVYWLEGRPQEGGRQALVRRGADGGIIDVSPPEFNVRTRVHEYGGGSYVVDSETAYCVNYTDQRLYRCRAGEAAEAITAEGKQRFADMVVDRGRGRLIAVCEDHSESSREAVNSIVAIDLAGGGVRVLASGADFYSNPRLSPDGSRLCWLEWNHPNMPWDGCLLRTAQLQADGSLGDADLIAGGPVESIFQPEWSPDGKLYFVSDRSGWWNLYSMDGGTVSAVVEREAEFGQPQWIFRRSTYGFADPGRIVCAYCRHGIWALADIDLAEGRLRPIESDFSDVDCLAVAGGQAVFRAASPRQPPAIVALSIDSGERTVLRQSSDVSDDLRRFFSMPETVEFAAAGNETAHGFFYPPNNPEFEAPEGERPPLIVITHGGPTGAATNSLSLSVQYWTSRGFGVLDVNYGGSSGYGRGYRARLDGKWGIIDIDDCVAGALWLAAQGRADRERLIIRGGSAGGYTTLAALTFRDVFRAGASYYGVSDLEALATETHKFESRYVDRLVGKLPEQRHLYDARSPIRHVENLSAPVIFFQGSEDKVVPPNQAERMLAVLRERGIPTSYLLFEGEQHGFRGGDNIKRALDAELYFYASVLLRKGLRY